MGVLVFFGGGVAESVNVGDGNGVWIWKWDMDMEMKLEWGVIGGAGAGGDAKCKIEMSWERTLINPLHPSSRNASFAFLQILCVVLCHHARLRDPRPTCPPPLASRP